VVVVHTVLFWDVVLSMDNIFSERHTVSIFKVEVCRVRNGFGCKRKCDSSHTWEGQRKHRVKVRPIQFPSCMGEGDILWSRKGPFPCSPFLLTIPSSIASPPLASLSDHSDYIHQCIPHPAFFNPDEVSSIFFSNAGLHLHDMTTQCQPRRP
jgi:hypothetical protein